jgi:hypothetical protein
VGFSCENSVCESGDGVEEEVLGLGKIGVHEVGGRDGMLGNVG